MERNLFQPCNLEEIKSAEPERPELEFDYRPCQKKFELRPEDEISIDSIFSGLLDQIEEPEKEFEGLKFKVQPKELHNDKQYLIFEEKLFISKLKHKHCKFDEPTKVFLERELDLIGEFWLNVEESYDGYVVFSKSLMTKDKTENKAGHTLRGKYDDRFLLICEKRMEYDHVDNVRVEKTLEARNQDNKKLYIVRETKIGSETQRFKASINIYGRTEIFLFDGGVMLFMRYLVTNNIRGERTYFTMNLFGKVLSCVLTIQPERKRVRIFNRTFDNTICIRTVQYFDNKPQETSDSFFTGDGRLVLHYWHGFNYMMHSVRAPAKPQERIIPKLELMWRGDNILVKRYQLAKTLNYEAAIDYLAQNPEMVDFVNDYIQALLKYKPSNVLEFSMRFFQNMRNTF